MFCRVWKPVMKPEARVLEIVRGQRKRVAWYDKHQRVGVCYNELFFVTLGFLAYN